MNETASLQKQDITPIYYKLDEIVQLLEKIIELLRLLRAEDAIK